MPLKLVIHIVTQPHTHPVVASASQFLRLCIYVIRDPVRLSINSSSGCPVGLSSHTSLSPCPSLPLGPIGQFRGIDQLDERLIPKHQMELGRAAGCRLLDMLELRLHSLHAHVGFVVLSIGHRAQALNEPILIVHFFVSAGLHGCVSVEAQA